MEEITKTIFIEGMQCEHCKLRVEKTLKSIDCVTDVEVSLENKNAIIKVNKNIENNKIIEAIDDIGFTVKEII